METARKVVFVLGAAIVVSCGGVLDTGVLLCPAGTTNTTTGCTPVSGLDGSVRDGGRPDGGPNPRPDAGDDQLIVDPSFINFGFVPIRQVADVTVRIVNPSSRSSRVALTQRPRLPFDTNFPPVAVDIPAFDSVEFRVMYRPTEPGSFESVLGLDCGPGCARVVPIVGTTSASPIECGFIDFGPVPMNTCRSIPLFCTNVSDARVVIVGAEITPPQPFFSATLPIPSVVGAGEAIEAEASFCPGSAGFAAAIWELELSTDGMPLRVQAAELLGEGVGMPEPCRIVTSPIDFGRVPIGGNVSRASFIENIGESRCEVTVEGLIATGDPGFSIVSPPVGTSIVLDGGSRFQIAVAFSPRAAGPLTSAVQLRSGDPNNPNPQVPLLGIGDDTMTASYTITSSAGVTFPDTSGGTAVQWSGSTDDGQSDLMIPFPFDFLGVIAPMVHVSTNGFVTFANMSVGSLSNQTLPQGPAPNSLLALWWDDLNPGMGGQVKWNVTGNAPDRVFWVHYIAVPIFGDSTMTINTSIALREDNIVDIYYGTIVAGMRPFTATAGWENSNGTRGANALPCAPLCNVLDWPTNTRFTYTPN